MTDITAGITTDHPTAGAEAALHPSRSRAVGAGWLSRGVVVLAIASLAFEQSPANEAVRANLAFSVLDHTGNALTVGLAVLLITLIIEGVPGVAIAGGLHLHPRLARRLMRKSGDITPPDDEPDRSRGKQVTGLLTDAGIALGIGAGLVVVRRHWTEPDRSFRQDLRTCAGACLVVAVVSGIIGFLVAGGIRHAAKVGLERPAELVVDYATDWRFWLVVVVAIQGGAFLAGRFKNRAANPSEA